MIKGMILNETAETVQIITFSSSNIKTGDMAQIWILNRDIDPVTALKNGDSKKICFDCPHLENGTCYVNVGQAPAQVYKAYKKGLYAPLDLDILKAMIKWKAVRFGAYGEPVLIPLDLVKFIAENSRGYTGYTHQWKRLEYLDYAPYFMASTETIEEGYKASQMGYRSFRVAKTEDTSISLKEIQCPNIDQGVQCRDCQLCNGQSNGKNIVVPVHGTSAKVNKFNLINL